MVSGSISLPSRGTFHLSLTVLSAIGGKEYLALDGGPPRFTQGYSCPALLGKQTEDQSLSPTRLSLPVAPLSRGVRLRISFLTSRLSRSSPVRSHYPHLTKAASHMLDRFRLIRFRSPLLTESLRFLLLGLLRCFSSPTYPRIAMNSLYADSVLTETGCPIRESPDLRMFAPPRRVSPLAAPFIGSLPQGIHHTPFVA